MKIFIGIDLGTSGCRAIAIDETGAVKSVMTRPLPLSDGKKPGQRQQKPEHWWQAVMELRLWIYMQHSMITTINYEANSIRSEIGYICQTLV
ncbi:MAG: hypothetical protein KZQ79_05705 [Candidatus Thiodiazotropha sp. (ex Lucinoma borealis)]|nr:hypothetical protein [Candidatus Thiodiazotropha sp. (ex Lucinoma borealis)]